jgi:hypothetical protein
MSIPDVHAFAKKLLLYAIAVFRWIYKQNPHKSRAKPVVSVNRILAEIFSISGYNVLIVTDVTYEFFKK